MPTDDGVCADDVVALVRRAADGDHAAWDRLVERFAGLVWSVARSAGLSPADAADVSQTAWLRLAEHLGRLREPARVGAWLAATARHEAQRVSRRASRQVLLDTFSGLAVEAEAPAADRRVLDEERDAALWRAFDALPPPCKGLLRVLITEPPPSYAEVSAALGMPIGSIGPTRGRCLQQLRRNTEEAAEAPRTLPHPVKATRRAAG